MSKNKRGISKGTQKKIDALKPRQREYVAGRLSGKSKRRSALDAGYSEMMANTAAKKIERPSVTDALRSALQDLIPIEHLALRIAEGLDAEVTEFATFQGEICDERNFVDFGERRQYAALAAKVLGVKSFGDVEVEQDDGKIIVRIDC
jgi:hypothetical protein